MSQDTPQEPALRAQLQALGWKSAICEERIRCGDLQQCEVKEAANE